MLNGAKITLSGQDGMTNGHYNNIFQQHTTTVLNIRQLWRSIELYTELNIAHDNFRCLFLSFMHIFEVGCTEDRYHTKVQ